jgi:hypothetical protein
MMDIDQYISKSGKEDVWIYGEDKHAGGNVTLTSATFQVFDKDKVSVQAQAAATLSDNGTATPDVYGLVDCTAAGFTDGEYYDVLFLITIGSEIHDFTAHIKCGEAP